MIFALGLALVAFGSALLGVGLHELLRTVHSRRAARERELRDARVRAIVSRFDGVIFKPLRANTGQATEV